MAASRASMRRLWGGRRCAVSGSDGERPKGRQVTVSLLAHLTTVVRQCRRIAYQCASGAVWM